MTLLDGLLGGRYRLQSQIAVGGMGEVWRADDTVLARTVAVKTLKPEYVGDEEFRARFRAEARHAAGLVHPGIASVYDYGESDDRAWLVMELVDGEPLSTLLHREGPLGPDRTLDVVAQTAAALQVAHDGGIVHRDVKPGNLLVRPDGVLKVTDFGIASAVDAAPLTRTGSLVGTAYYLSPEQASGTDVVPASDLYSLGVVAYECLTGVRPFPGDNPMAIAMAHLHSAPPPLPASVPPPVRALVDRLLSKDPRSRGDSAGRLGAEATALRAALSAGAGPTEIVPGLAALPVEPPAGAGADHAAAATPAHTRVLPAAPIRSSHRRAVRSAAVLLAVLALGLGLRTALTPELTRVPVIEVGMSETRALAALQAAGLAVVRSAERSAQIPAGGVLEIRPGAGSEVDAGSEVIMVVSSGLAPVTVRAEDEIGRPAGEVRARLTARGLVARLIDDGVGSAVGTVSGVDPVGDLAVGSTVVLHVVPAPPSPAPQQRDRDAADEAAADLADAAEEAADRAAEAADRAAEAVDRAVDRAADRAAEKKGGKRR